MKLSEELMSEIKFGKDIKSNRRYRERELYE